LHERDLIVAVLAAQAGFVSPSEVLAAAAAGLVDAGPDSLLTRLENSGALNLERRKVLEAVAEQALAARNGDARAVLTSMGAANGVIETLVSSIGAATRGNNGQPAASVAVPLERPGQYTRLGELGRGSQSIVRVARDEIVGREVALKELASLVLPADDDSSRAARARFLREVRLVAGLDHPGIVAIHELARREDGTLFCAQKLVRGENLQCRIAACRSLADRLGLVRHVLDACQAMGFAHVKHVVHRDLKPSNVMVGEYGETVVVDWGLAKRQEEAEEVVPLAPASEPSLTVAGVALGTPAYMSPEQARGDLPAIDARSDVFSLGAILYQVLTGHPPFEGVSSEHILENVRAGRFPPVLTISPEAPPELAAIAERALRPEPSERYRDAEELAREVSAYLAGGRVRAYQYGAWELLRKFASSHRALLTGVAIAAAALVVTSIFVAVRLHLTRVDLASAFLQRAYGAEQEGDWSKAAAYFAAARAQHDTTEERWGLGVAKERITERIVSLHGPADSFTDVGVLPDGRVITVGHAADRVEVREVESGKTLWTHSGEPVLDAEILSGGLLSLSRAGGWVFHDAATGRELQAWPRSSGFPCPGPYPPRAATLNGQLLQQEEGGATRIVASDVFPGSEICVVSDDGRRVAYHHASGGMRLVALDDGRELARRKFESFQGLSFTRHGLVVFKQGRLEVLGGPDGDFSIELPEAKFGTWEAQVLWGGSAVSPDGELVAVAGRQGATQSMVVDLRSRSIRAVLHYPPGWPRLAFSLDGQRIFAAGVNNASVLSGWRLPPDDTPRTPRWWTMGLVSESGRSALLFSIVSGSFELFKPAGTLFASGVRSLGHIPRLEGDGPAVGFIASDGNAVVLHDLEKDRVLWQHPCRACWAISVSEDGSRFALVGADGLEVWDTRADRRIFQETRRARPVGVGGTSEACECSTLSGDGRRLAWTFGDKLLVRDLDSGEELTLPLDGALLGLRFSPEAAQLVAITTRSTTLRDTGTGRAIWSVANDLPNRVDLIYWSPDGRALLLFHGWNATEVLDVRTGERLAWFQTLNRAVTPIRAEFHSPDLKVKSVATQTTWDTRSVPQPDETPAAESLARILQRTGLEFRGVEVVAAP
jgi:serine/threonine protein kinase